MELNHRLENNVCIISIEGHILQDEVETYRNYLDPWLQNDTIDVVLINLAKVQIIDSSGVAALMTTFRTLETRHAKLLLSNLSSQCREILRVIGLDGVLNIYDTEENALAALK